MVTTLNAGLDLTGCAAVVCGAGASVLGSVRALQEAGAAVTVIGEHPVAALADLADRSSIRLIPRPAAPADLDGCAVTAISSGDPEVDRGLRAAARVRGIPVLGTQAGDDRASTQPPGSVVLVGGGPGDPGLITVAGLDAVRGADVIVSDRLAPLSVLRRARGDAVIIDVAKIPRGPATAQDRISAILIEHARAGRRVVRLKGGDNFVFGRGGEEWQACAAAGVPVTIIPGVSSAVAGPALAGIPLTHRDLTQGFAVVSGHLPPGDPGSSLDWPALARANITLVIMMGLATLPAITAELIKEALAPRTPAMTIADAGLPTQRVIRGALEDIAAATEAAGIRPPAITVIGAVAAFRPDAEA